MELSINEIMEISKLYESKIAGYNFDKINYTIEYREKSCYIHVIARKWINSITVTVHHVNESANYFNDYKSSDIYYLCITINKEIVLVKDKDCIDLFANITEMARERFESKKEQKRISVIDKVLKSFGIR